MFKIKYFLLFLLEGVPMKNKVSYFKHNPHEVDPIIVKHKRNKTIENRQIVLCLEIISGEDIDNPKLHPSVKDRRHLVVAGVKRGEEILTKPALGLPNPVWDKEKHFILLRNYPHNHDFLYLEVLRFDTNKKDRGTSSGVILVVRTRIPLPKELYRKKRGRFGLMRAAGEKNKPEGHIELSMELKQCRYADVN